MLSPEDYEIPDGIEGLWPYNLASELSLCVCKDDREDFVRTTYAKGLIDAVDALPDRQRDVIRLRFKFLLTLDEIGKELKVTRERVRQVEAKALRELRRPSVANKWRMVTLEEKIQVQDELKKMEYECEQLKLELKALLDARGEDGTSIEARGEDGTSIEARMEHIPLEDTGLSVRPYNCLRRYGVSFLDQLDGMQMSQFLKIRNLGKKSLEEILKVMESYGLRVEDDIRTTEC